MNFWVAKCMEIIWYILRGYKNIETVLQSISIIRGNIIIIIKFSKEGNTKILIIIVLRKLNNQYRACQQKLDKFLLFVIQMVHSFATQKYHCLKANDVSRSCFIGKQEIYRAAVCEHHLPLGSGTSKWQNYGPLVWQQEKIHFILANRPCIG